MPDADLVRGEADAVVGVHRLAQILGEPLELGIELPHLGGLLTEHRVAVDAHGAHAHAFDSPASTCTTALFANSSFTSSATLSTTFAVSTPTTVP